MAPNHSSTLTLVAAYLGAGLTGAAVLLIAGLLSVRWGNPEDETVGDPTVRKEPSHA